MLEHWICADCPTTIVGKATGIYGWADDFGKVVLVDSVPSHCPECGADLELEQEVQPSLF